MAENRATLRSTLAALLAGHLPTAQRIYAYLPGTLGGETPIVALASAGTRRERMTARGSRPVFYVDVHVFALYASTTDGWTEEDAEESIDQIEAGVRDFIDATPTGEHWRSIRYGDRSRIDTILEEGFTYRHEVIPLEVT